jgi:hypothetical protein
MGRLVRPLWLQKLVAQDRARPAEYHMTVGESDLRELARPVVTLREFFERNIRCCVACVPLLVFFGHTLNSYVHPGLIPSVDAAASAPSINMRQRLIEIQKLSRNDLAKKVCPARSP